MSATGASSAALGRRPSGGAASRDRAAPPSARQIAAFYALTLAISWGWSFTLIAAGEIVRRGHGWPTSFPALFGPAIAAFVVTAWTRGRDGVADLGRRIVRWRIGPRWWAAALSPLAFLAVGLAIAVAAGSAPAARDFGRYTGWPAIGLAGAVLAATLNGVGEEVGWRGYLLPAFQQRSGARRAALIVGGLWALWHLPYFFLQSAYRDFGPPTVVAFVIGVVSGSVVLTWLYYGAGQSVLAAIAWHAAFNMASATDASSGTIAAVVSTLVIVQAVVLLRLDGRARARAAPPVIGPDAPPRTVPGSGRPSPPR